ncbi:SGNH/GDSL hydrolase family protein [Rhodopirellula sp. P2]|uniref:SGNH/GDSL hydrolase family protein n=1 Tax=Rhodopirellula sp. P2 TaxID=2127060 RepID=UPI002368B676|nr:SGNH/GDSL hydrolase family protein [Rhodopirellula sp. P2]WDQ14623.1 SGNH/GDSL hydrolase family protein [Rhodopirellula sp. P2]
MSRRRSATPNPPNRKQLPRFGASITACVLLISLFSKPIFADESNIDLLANSRIAVVGDSITQAGHYVSFLSYQLQTQSPNQTFDVYPLGLSSETVSGLSEQGHAGGKFPRPCLFERFDRLLTKVQPDVLIACYGMNDGIYQPLEESRFAAFQNGIRNMIDQAQQAGVKKIYLVTPPIYDDEPAGDSFHYDTVLNAYARWETELEIPGVKVIDLHTAMREARKERDQPFSKDKVHPNEEGHWLMAQTIASGLGVSETTKTLAEVKADPVFASIDAIRNLRWKAWMNHIGYTREKTYPPQPLGDTEALAAKQQDMLLKLLQQ